MFKYQRPREESPQETEKAGLRTEVLFSGKAPCPALAEQAKPTSYKGV